MSLKQRIMDWYVIRIREPLRVGGSYLLGEYNWYFPDKTFMEASNREDDRKFDEIEKVFDKVAKKYV